LFESEPVIGGSNRADPENGFGTGVSDIRTTSVPHPISKAQRPQVDKKRIADFEFTGDLQNKASERLSVNNSIKALFRLRSSYLLCIGYFCRQSTSDKPIASEGKSSWPK